MGAFALTLALLALVLLIMGYRGRRVDEHPLCKKCRFDLTGLPTTSSNCPECGANIRNPGSTRLGNRLRRPRLLVAGWMIAIPALLFSAVLVYLTAAHISLIHYKPLSMLTADIESPAPATWDPALAEISRRVAAGEIHEADLAPVVDRILAWQADAAHRWNPSWGNLIEACRAGGNLSAARWEKYLGQAVNVRFIVSPKVHRGTNPDLIVKPSGPRFDSVDHPGTSPLVNLSVEWTLQVEGAALHDTAKLELWFDRTDQLEGGALEDGGGIAAPQSKPFAEGKHIARVEYTITFTYVDGTTGIASGAQTLTFETLPATAPLEKTRHDTEARAALMKTLAFGGPGASASGFPDIPLSTPQPAQPNTAPVADCFLFQMDPPFRGQFNVELVQGDSHWPCTSSINILAGVGGGNRIFLDRSRAPDLLPHAGSAAILLIPIPSDAHAAPINIKNPDEEIEDIFDGELGFPVNLVP